MKKIIFAICFCFVFIFSVFSQSDIEKNFLNPPSSARPGVWWRWVGGCISKEGITRDLSEMHRMGITSVEHFDVAGPCTCDSLIHNEKWFDYLNYTLDEAARYGIEFRKVPYAGWGIGGPWFTPERAAKRLEYKEVQVDGPGQVNIVLPKPKLIENFYHDIAILAYKEKSGVPIKPVFLNSSGNERLGWFQECFYPALAADKDQNTFWSSLKINGSGKAEWLGINFDKEYNFTSLYLAPVPFKTGIIKTWKCRLLLIDDAGNEKLVSEFDIKTDKPEIIKFNSTKGKSFKISVRTDYNTQVMISEAWLLRDGDEAPRSPGIKWWMVKSANFGVWDYPTMNDGGNKVLYDEYPEDGNLDCKSNELIDLTAKVDGEGKLNWIAPAGHWTIIRFGYVLLGETTRQAENLKPSGYESDPYNTGNMDYIFEKSINPICEKIGKHAGTTFSSLLIDSWELGALTGTFQPTWTDKFRDEFIKRRGYDLIKYLPAMANKIVDSREITNRFLWDYRKTLSELYNDFYARYTELAHQKGLYTSAQCGYGTMPHHHIDGLAAYGRVDVPESEFWINSTCMTSKSYFCDPTRTASSAAHIYNKKVVSAESFTAADGFTQTPEYWKVTADREFCKGLNHLMISEFSHQFDAKARPGLSFYESINANMTWWNQCGAFIDYIGRCSYMLQQGKHVADFAYFVGEGSLKFVPSKEFLQPALPAGFDYDGINAEVLMTLSKIENNKLVMTNGIAYKYLVLPNIKNWDISVPLLKKLKEYVESGLTIIGNRPAHSNGLNNYLSTDKEIAALSDYLWGKDKASSGTRNVKKGRVIWGKSVIEIAKTDQLSADIDFKNADYPDLFKWIHNIDGNTDIYFISNNNPETKNFAKIALRVTGKRPELWNPITGKSEKLPEWKIENGCIEIPLAFEPKQSFFIILKESIKETAGIGKNQKESKQVLDISKDWKIKFDDKWGGPVAEISYPTLESWTESSDFAIRYFSGTAVYKKSFGLSSVKKENRLFIDLGRVKNIATVKLNGKDAGTAWCDPWQIDITDAVVPGINQIEIAVSNVWFNRMIYEFHLYPNERLTKSNEYPSYNADPMESGLLGPVIILEE